MNDPEFINRQQIESLNQRGGRTLSIVDLILANTVSVELASHVATAVAGGASFLTAAKPSGVGKTALLAAFLAFLPEGMPIVTVDDSNILTAAEQKETPTCYLAHEIGSGHWYGYIWGPMVERYLELASGPHMVASCLHADTMDELFDALISCSAADPIQTLSNIDFVLFMQADGSLRHSRRRVTAVHELDRDSGTHKPIFLWEPQSDHSVRTDERATEAEAKMAPFLRRLAANGTTDYGTVRREYLALGKI